MIDQSFLDNLKGLEPEVAKYTCILSGYNTRSMNEKQIITLEAKPNTILLWYNIGTNLVSKAITGDGCELVKD